MTSPGLFGIFVRQTHKVRIRKAPCVVGIISSALFPRPPAAPVFPQPAPQDSRNPCFWYAWRKG